MGSGKPTRGHIPFNRPTFVGSESEYIAQAIARHHISGDGYFTSKCHELLERTLNVPKALLTTSCTHALEMAALLLDINPGDEVIMPSFTFVSTANAFFLRGARPVFVDIRPDTLNLDETLIEKNISEKTKAIAPVHYAGVGCDMDVICSLAAKYNVAVVEDNAHGLFGRYGGKQLGTFGAMSTQSFHETKNFSCGEGGALIVNDPAFVERAEIIREKGTNRSRFFRGQVDKYTWVDVGSSYLPSDILAAILLAQLEQRTAIQERRRKIWDTYHQNLQAWAPERGITLPTVPANCEQAYHLYYMLLPSLDIRQALIEHLRARDIYAVFHYLPLHTSEVGRRLGGKEGDCPVTEAVADRLLRLPFYYELSEQDQMRVIDALFEFNPRSASSNGTSAAGFAIS
jgi:dTDP-4-amino-4,6-dideoxygalactose transaminase